MGDWVCRLQIRVLPEAGHPVQEIRIEGLTSHLLQRTMQIMRSPKIKSAASARRLKWSARGARPPAQQSGEQRGIDEIQGAHFDMVRRVSCFTAAPVTEFDPPIRSTVMRFSGEVIQVQDFPDHTRELRPDY